MSAVVVLLSSLMGFGAVIPLFSVGRRLRRRRDRLASPPADGGGTGCEGSDGPGQERKSFLDDLIESSPDGILAFDRDCRYTLWNPAMEHLSGFRKDRVLGRSAMEVFPFLEETGADRYLYAALAGETVTAADARYYIPATGIEGYFDGRYAPLRDETGAVLGGFAIIRDVTQRRRTEDELRNRTHQQAVIAQLGLSALSGRALQALLDELTETVARTLGVEYCKILECLPGGSGSLLRAGVGWRPGLVGHALVGSGAESQAGYTLASREPVIVTDLASETRFSGPPLLIEHGVVSGMSVIIEGGERPFGVLGAHTAARREFTRDDVHFLQSAANLLAISIERKHAEERTRNREEMFRRLLEAAPDAMVIVEADGRIFLVNEETERMFGYSRGELIGQPVEMLMAPGQRERHQALRAGFISNARARPIGAGFELQGLRKNGDLFPVEISLSPLKRGAATLVTAAIRDITERLRAEAALRASEERFRRLADNAPDIVYRYRYKPTRGFEYVSPAATGITGYTPEEHYADPDLGFKLIHPEDRPLFESLARDGPPGSFEGALTFRFVRKDGTVAWTEQRNVPVMDDGGELVGIEGIARDITDRRRAEETIAALMRISQTLNSTLELDPLLDALVTEAVELLDGMSGRAGLRSPAGMECHRCFRNGGLARCGAAWPAGVGLAGWVLEHKDIYLTNDAEGDPQVDRGDLATFGMRSAICAPMIDARGGVVGFLAVHNKRDAPGFGERDRGTLAALADIGSIAIQNALAYSTLQDAQSALRQASQKLLDAHEDERRFIARELHDEAGQSLIALMIDLARLERDVQIPAGAIRERVAELKRRVGDIQEGLHRLASDLRPAVLDHAGLVPAIEQFAHTVGARHGFEVRLSGSEFERRRLPAQMETALYRIVQEALTNVVRHARASRVDIILQPREGDILLVVEDNGVGFEPSTPLSPGHLGLIGIRERAEAFGGQIVIDSSPNHGTTLVVRIRDADSSADR
jgi:PAS domain S-box-containing protein